MSLFARPGTLAADPCRSERRLGDLPVRTWGANAGHYFMVPASLGNPDWHKNVLWGQEIREELLESPGRKVLLLNTCPAASILETPVGTHGLPNTEIVCCTRAHEVSGPAFAMDKALIRGLQGAAVNSQGVVTVGSLVHFLKVQVKHATHDKEHVTVAGPRHMGANHGSTVSSLANLPLGA